MEPGQNRFNCSSSLFSRSNRWFSVFDQFFLIFDFFRETNWIEHLFAIELVELTDPVWFLKPCNCAKSSIIAINRGFYGQSKLLFSAYWFSNHNFNHNNTHKHWSFRWTFYLFPQISVEPTLSNVHTWPNKKKRKKQLA